MHKASWSAFFVALVASASLAAEDSDDERRPVIVVAGTAVVRAAQEALGSGDGTVGSGQ